MKLVYHLRRNTDGTITIRVGRMVEYISTTEKDKSRIFDEVKYALISKDVFVSDVRLTEELHELFR